MRRIVMFIGVMSSYIGVVGWLVSRWERWWMGFNLVVWGRFGLLSMREWILWLWETMFLSVTFLLRGLARRRGIFEPGRQRPKSHFTFHKLWLDKREILGDQVKHFYFRNLGYRDWEARSDMWCWNAYLYLQNPSDIGIRLAYVFLHCFAPPSTISLIYQRNGK